MVKRSEIHDMTYFSRMQIVNTSLVYIDCYRGHTCFFSALATIEPVFQKQLHFNMVKPSVKRGKRKKREIRVFVSSTFRDFKAEREELIKKTFREVRYFEKVLSIYKTPIILFHICCFSILFHIPFLFLVL